MKLSRIFREIAKKIGRFRFRKAWAWPAPVDDFIALEIEGFSLHVCNGLSKLGDVTLDLFTEANIKGDMFHLPFLPETFDTVICDPPWRMPIHKRPAILYQLRDVLKIGGKLIFNSQWRINFRSFEIERYIIVDSSAAWSNLHLIQIARRVQ